MLGQTPTPPGAQDDGRLYLDGDRLHTADKTFLKRGVITFTVPPEAREDILWLTKFLQEKGQLDPRDDNSNDMARMALYKLVNEFKAVMATVHTNADAAADNDNGHGRPHAMEGYP